MPEPYVVEPPPERQREMSTQRKLDQILAAVTGKGGEGNNPEVTFEPDPTQLPQEPGGEEPEVPEDEAGQGEGTANVAQPTERKRFRFPSARRSASPER